MPPSHVVVKDQLQVMRWKIIQLWSKMHRRTHCWCAAKVEALTPILSLVKLLSRLRTVNACVTRGLAVCNCIAY